MLQVRENDISLRKWSGGTAPLRTLGAQRHLRRKWSGGTAPLRTLDIDQQSVFFVVLHISYFIKFTILHASKIWTTKYAKLNSLRKVVFWYVLRLALTNFCILIQLIRSFQNFFAVF